MHIVGDGDCYMVHCGDETTPPHLCDDLAAPLGDAACGPRGGDPQTLVALFKACARANPEGIALAEGDRRLTYGELDRRAGRFAEELGAVLVGPDQIVAILAAAGIETMVAILGVLEAGAAYFPLAPNEPQARLVAMLHDVGPAAI